MSSSRSQRSTCIFRYLHVFCLFCEQDKQHVLCIVALIIFLTDFSNFVKCICYMIKVNDYFVISKFTYSIEIPYVFMTLFVTI